MAEAMITDNILNKLNSLINKTVEEEKNRRRAKFLS